MSPCSSQVSGKRAGSRTCPRSSSAPSHPREVDAVEERLRVVVEGHEVGDALVLREQRDRRLAARVAVTRVAPARLVLVDVVVEREEQAGLGEVAHLLDRRRDGVEAAVLRRGVAEVRLVLGRRRGLDELELDPRLLLEQSRRSRRRAVWRLERRLELRLREVERLHDDRVGCRAVLHHLAERRDRAPLLGVDRVLVALGAGEAHGAAVHAVGQAFLERLARRGRSRLPRVRRRCLGVGRSRRRRGLVASAAARCEQQAEAGRAGAGDERLAADRLLQQLLTRAAAPSSSPAFSSFLLLTYETPAGRHRPLPNTSSPFLKTISNPVPVSRQACSEHRRAGDYYQRASVLSSEEPLGRQDI